MQICFNHLLVNPDGSRFIFLHRWRYPDAERNLPFKEVGGFGTRMFTAGIDGTDLRVIDPYNYTSHFIWRDPSYILAWTRIPDKGSGIMKKLPGTKVLYARGCDIAENIHALESIPAKMFFITGDMKENGIKGEYFNNGKLEGRQPGREAIESKSVIVSEMVLQ